MMKNNLIKLANKFFAKYSQALEGEDPKSVVADACFCSKDRSKTEKTFLSALNSPNSNFQKAIQNVTGNINIGAKVDATAKFADLMVDVPGADKKTVDKVKDALVKDYVNHYGKTPAKNFTDKLILGLVKPADVVTEHPAVITF